MLVSKIVGYKSKLTPDYSNVFDGYNNKIDYVNFLNEIYDYVTIYDGNEKSFRIDNNNVTIEVYGEYDLIREYNYFAFYKYSEDTNPTFYFGVSYSSINDIPNKQITRITFEYDSFANNIDLLSNSFDFNRILRRHFIETKLLNNNLVTNNIITDEEELPTKALPTDTTQIVLWAKCTFGNEAKALNINSGGISSDYTKLVNYSAIDNSNSAPIGYIPIYVINPKTNEIDSNIKTAYTHINNLTGATEKVIRNMLKSDGTVNPIYTNGSDLLSIELTYYAPFEYFFYDNKLIITSIKIGLDDDSPGFAPTEESTAPYNTANVFGAYDSSATPAPLIYEGEDFGVFSQFNKACNLLWYYNNVNVKSFYNQSFDSFYTMPDYKPQTLASIQFEPRMNIYPYSYKAYIKNLELIPLIPHYNSNQFVLEIKANETKPLFRIGLQDEINGIKFTNVENDGELVTTVDSTEYYKRNKGVFSLVKSIAPIATMGLYSGKKFTPKRHLYTAKYKRHLQQTATGVGEDLFSQGIDYIQSHYQMDMVKLPSVNAFDNIYMQDRIDIVEVEVEDTFSKNNMFRFIHKYGITFNAVGSVSLNTHKLFDFVKTLECDLPFIQNITDRNKIENAYDRGITRWHINSYGLEGVNKSAFSTFNTNYTNLDTVSYDYYYGGE